MSSRSQIIDSLSLIPTVDLLSHLDEATLLNLSDQYYQSTMEPYIIESRDAKPSLAASVVAAQPISKTKRPLNGFMAFRSELILQALLKALLTIPFRLLPTDIS
jgi:hypothetical protein